MTTTETTPTAAQFTHIYIAAEHLRVGDLFIIGTGDRTRFVEAQSIHFEYSDNQVQVITDGGVVRFYDDERVFVTRDARA